MRINLRSGNDRDDWKVASGSVSRISSPRLPLSRLSVLIGGANGPRTQPADDRLAQTKKQKDSPWRTSYSASLIVPFSIDTLPLRLRAAISDCRDFLTIRPTR